MPTSLECCAAHLAADGVRHHVDLPEGAIRVALVTGRYCNPRGEHLAIVRIEAPDGGHRCRVAIERAFLPRSGLAAACLELCRLAAETPLVGVEYDAAGGSLGLVAEIVVEDGDLTALQLLSMVDAVVAAAEAWHAVVGGSRTGPARRPGRRPGRRVA